MRNRRTPGPAAASRLTPGSRRRSGFRLVCAPELRRRRDQSARPMFISVIAHHARMRRCGDAARCVEMRQPVADFADAVLEVAEAGPFAREIEIVAGMASFVGE